MKMVIVYHGRLEQIVGELERAKPVLDRRYAEIFGEEGAGKIAEASKRLLGPESFYDCVASLNSKVSSPLGSKFSSDIPSRHITLVSIQPDNLYASGFEKQQKLRTAPVIYIHPSGTLQTYIHEFGHFIWYALQSHPISVLNSLYGGHKIESFTDYSEKVLGQTRESDEEKMVKLQRAFWSLILGEISEKSNQILEKLILESIGVDVKLPWRGKEREYALHKKFGFRIPIDGDPFLGIGDYEVVKRMLTWQDYIVPKGPGAGNPISNLPFYYMLDSYLNNVRISRLPIGEFLQLAKKDKSSSHHKPQNHRQ